MARFFGHKAKPAAQAPGTVAFHGERKVERVTAQVIDYDAETFEERGLDDLDASLAYRDTDTVSWINVHGLHDTTFIRKVGEHFGIHPLVLEDIVNTHQRPKMEDFGRYAYFVCRMLSYDDETGTVTSEQVSLVLGEHWLLTFQERPGDVFEPVRERLRRGNSRIRSAAPGYLCYALIDAVVDHYFHVLERFGDETESLEEALLDPSRNEDLSRIHTLKRELVILKRAAWPMREMVARLERDDLPLMGDQVSPYLRDLYDHVVQVAEAVESYRDLLGGLHDLYMSNVSNRMNEVMKVLTVFASIFVPLTFVAGIYGMNFAYMPELAWRWSYPLFWVVILALVGGMLVFFRRRRWL